MVFHWVLVNLQSSLVALFGYVLHFRFCYLSPMVSHIILLVSWRNDYVLKLKVWRKHHRDFCLEIEDFYEGFFVLCTLVSVYYNILLSRMGIICEGKLCHLRCSLYPCLWHNGTGIFLIVCCYGSGTIWFQNNFCSFQIFALNHSWQGREYGLEIWD